MSELILAFLSGLVGGGVFSLAHKWTLYRISSQLQLDVEELKERLYHELKKRASLASRQKSDFDAEVQRLAAKTLSVQKVEEQSNSNWWWPKRTESEKTS